MKNGYPTYTKSAQKGESGVNIVAQIVNDQFGWVFKRNHQEYDFGIDGQLEVVTSSGSVTGQMAAVQIKNGPSFFKEKNKWGYVYRGERKHFNYLSNYPLPVFIIICNPETNECLWGHFVAEQTTGTEKGWKITIPFENDFRNSKSELLSLLPETKDNLGALETYWALNNLLTDSGHILFVFIPEEIESGDTSRVRNFFDRLSSSKELAHNCMNKVEFSFSGYDFDSRELFEIEGVRRYISQLSDALPEFLFFIKTENPGHTLRLFVASLCSGSIIGPRATQKGTKHKVVFDTKLITKFLNGKWPGLNTLTHWLNMSEDENKAITYSVFRCLGFDIPED